MSNNVAEGVQQQHATIFQLLPPAGIAFGEVVYARCAIANKFALHSLTHNIPSCTRGRVLLSNNVAEGVQQQHATIFQLLPPAGIAFGEVVYARCAIANKFALHSLTHNIPSCYKRESFLGYYLAISFLITSRTPSILFQTSLFSKRKTRIPHEFKNSVLSKSRASPCIVKCS